MPLSADAGGYQAGRTGSQPSVDEASIDIEHAATAHRRTRIAPGGAPLEVKDLRLPELDVDSPRALQRLPGRLLRARLHLAGANDGDARRVRPSLGQDFGDGLGAAFR